jgi:hypothetical protein
LTEERLVRELGTLLNELDRAVAATFEASRMRATTSSRGMAAGRRQRLRGALLALFGRRRAEARFRASSS